MARPPRKIYRQMKQLGSLPKEERPAAGKQINLVKIELETAHVRTPRPNWNLNPPCPKNPPISPCPDDVGPWANFIR